MSSARGLLGHPAGYTAYCASKSAVDGITKALGCEWGDERHHRQCARADGFPLAADANGCSRTTSARKTVRKGFLTRVPKGPPRRAGRSRRPAAVPRLEGIRLLYRPHPLRRRRLHGGLTMTADPAKARIAVIGAGLMGHGIAQVFALAGHDVTITDSCRAKSRDAPNRASPPICAISATTKAPSRACARAPISPTRCATPTTSSRRSPRIWRSSRSCLPRSNATCAPTPSSPATPR